MLLGEYDLRKGGGQDFPDDPVGAVTNASLAQTAIENDPEAVCVGVLFFEQVGGTLRTHSMGG